MAVIANPGGVKQSPPGHALRASLCAPVAGRGRSLRKNARDDTVKVFLTTTKKGEIRAIRVLNFLNHLFRNKSNVYGQPPL